MEHRQELRMRTAQRIQERAMPSMENFTEQQRLHHESVMRRQMLLAKLELAKQRVGEISGRRKIKSAGERGLIGGRLRGGFWGDIGRAFENAFDPNKNGFTQAVIAPIEQHVIKPIEQAVIAPVVNELTNPDSVMNRGINDAANKVANEFTNPNSVLAAGTSDVLRRIDNEFTNPDSVMRRGAENAFDPNKNGVGEAFKKVANEFDNPNSDFRRGVGAAAEVLKSTLEGPVRNFLMESFDPNKNGLGDAFRKFGRDTEAAFQEFGNKMASTFSKEEMERTFAPLKDAFERFGNATDTWFKSVDPMVWIIVASSVLTVAGTIASFGLAGPALMGANAALISAAGAAVTIGGKAALGRKIDPTDVAGLVLSLLPVPGVSAAAGAGSNAIFRTLSAIGQTAAGMSKAQVALAAAQTINGIAAAQQKLPGGLDLTIGFGKPRRRGKGMAMDFAEKIANITRHEILENYEDEIEDYGEDDELTGGSWQDAMAQFGRQPAYQKVCPMNFDPVYDAQGTMYSNSCHAPDGVQTFPYNPNPNPRPRPRPFMPTLEPEFFIGGTPDFYARPQLGVMPDFYGQDIPMRRSEPYTEFPPTSNMGLGSGKKGKKGGRVAQSPCPSFCKNAGNMHPVCVQGRKDGRPNCGVGGFT